MPGKAIPLHDAHIRFASDEDHSPPAKWAQDVGAGHKDGPKAPYRPRCTLPDTHRASEILSNGLISGCFHQTPSRLVESAWPSEDELMVFDELQGVVSERLFPHLQLVDLQNLRNTSRDLRKTVCAAPAASWLQAARYR